MVIHEHFARGARARDVSAGPPIGSQPAFRLLEFPVGQHHLRIAPRASWYSTAAKRGLDLCVASTLLIALAPILVLVGLAIRFESAGPALFRQQRLGLNGKPFRIFKFRTMHVLEDGEHVQQAEPNDKRVTRVGRFLRASSLDELPQFVNVLQGDMSLVGPRPHAVAHDRQFGSLIANYALRRQVKPGITGWAQVNGFRGPTPTVDMMRRRIDCDIWYVQNASIRLDIGVLLRTPRELLRRRNAY